MAYVPPNSEWYVAEILEEITVQGDSRNVLHRNLVLIRASSPDEAYERAVAIGRQGEITYENPAGRSVSIRFRGLKDLNVVYDELEHGTELLYSEQVSVSDEEIASLVVPKEQLSVFQEIVPTQGPDYGCKEIEEEVEKLLSSQSQKLGTEQ
jgi:hypothetical protein